MTKTEPVEAADFYGPLKEETIRAEAATKPSQGLVVYETDDGEKLAVTLDAAVALIKTRHYLRELKAHEAHSPWMTARIVVDSAESAERDFPECRKPARRMALEAMAAAPVAVAELARKAAEQTAETLAAVG